METFQDKRWSAPKFLHYVYICFYLLQDKDSLMMAKQELIYEYKRMIFGVLLSPWVLFTFTRVVSIFTVVLGPWLSSVRVLVTQAKSDMGLILWRSP